MTDSSGTAPAAAAIVSEHAQAVGAGPLAGPGEAAPQQPGSAARAAEAAPAQAPQSGLPENGAQPDGAPVGEAPPDGAQPDGAPVDGAPVDGAPVDGLPVDGAPGDEPADGAPSDGAPSDGALADGDRVDGGAEDGAAGGGPAADAVALADLAGGMRELRALSERYHSRAAARESVIDHLHAEVDRLRRGERRGLLRPLLSEVCRLRDDLLRQADQLPADFDAERAAALLRSYAETVELALVDNGVMAYSPQAGDPFEPRRHRRLGSEPTADPALAGRVARVRRSGYQDMETDAPLAPAEVVLYTAAAEPAAQPAPATHERETS